MIKKVFAISTLVLGTGISAFGIGGLIHKALYPELTITNPSKAGYTQCDGTNLKVTWKIKNFKNASSTNVNVVVFRTDGSGKTPASTTAWAGSLKANLKLPYLENTITKGKTVQYWLSVGDWGKSYDEKVIRIKQC